MSAPTPPCEASRPTETTPAATTGAAPTAAAATPTARDAAGSLSYSGQARGGADEYASYYAGMDKSMQQKVALTTAYFPAHGCLADMGCGSGKGSFDLACLHSGLRVVGIDVAAESVAYARGMYERGNLDYRVGDIAQPLFPPGSLDGALNSSVWHHLTSFNGFSLREVERALHSQTAALRPGGVLIVRDFVVPRGPDEVLLDLPDSDGTSAGDGDVAGAAPTALSTAALFQRFAAGFRSSQNLTGPVPFARLPDSGPGWHRYRVGLRHATEFLLRKDYREHWDAELREEYLFFTQAEYEAALRRHDLRVVLSVELHNPWIRENRFRGRFFLWDLDGRRLPFPPTNFLIVGEKVAAGRGVAFSLRRGEARPPRFLRRELFVDTQTGQRFELCARPNPVVDLIPYFQKDGRLFVLGKQGFPRPLVNAAPDSPNLDAATVAGYLTEPLSAQRAEPESGQLSVAEAVAILGERAGLPPACIAAVQPGLRYFTSPGGLSERVTASLIELRPITSPDSDGELPLPDEAPNYSGFVSAGRVRPLDARQLLRAAQVGGLLDARLELNTHHLLRVRGEPLGPWIGAEIGLSEQPTRPGLGSRAAVSELLRPPPTTRFAPCPPEAEGRFLEVFTTEIREHDSTGRVLASVELEVVAPRPVSCSTALVLPVVRAGGVDYVGLELRDLPAVQAATGSSRILTCPAWRLPRSVMDLEQAEAHALRVLADQFGARARRAWPLGGKYYPAAGATPEVVYPLAAEIDIESVPGSSLHWLPLEALVAERAQIQDGHLLIALLRLSHALQPVG